MTGAQSLGNANNRPALSGDGRYVAFASDATDMLGAGLDTNNNPDIFVRDRTAATTSRVSVGAGGVEANNASLVPSISDDGRYVAFQSVATNLVAGDSNANWDIFVRDRQAAITERVSVASDESQGLLGSRDTAISSSGRYVVFNSDATNLVAGDTNSVRDVFLRDRTAGTTIRVSLRSDDQQGGGGSSSHPAVSENGDVIGFISGKTNLVTDDTNAVERHVRPRRERGHDRTGERGEQPGQLVGSEPGGQRRRTLRGVRLRCDQPRPARHQRGR